MTKPRGKAIPESEKKEIKKRFLITYSRTGNITASCERAGVAPRLIRDWLSKDPKFKAKFDEMQEKFIDSLEMVAVQRAMDKSDTLLLALLKANRPTKFRDNVKLDADVKQDKTVRLVFSQDELGAMPNYAHSITGGAVSDGADEETS